MQKYVRQKLIDPDKVFELDWAYFAGLIDGEGYIEFSHRKAYGKKALAPSYLKRGFVRTFKLSISSGNKWLLDEIVNRIGAGSIYSGKKNYQQLARATNPNDVFVTYALTYFSKNLEIILEHVIPYLILKQRIAELTLAGLKIYLSTRREYSLIKEQEMLKLKEQYDVEFYEKLHSQAFNHGRLVDKQIEPSSSKPMKRKHVQSKLANKAEAKP